jgi:Na+/melibiose symporter-like transporter
MVVGALFLIPSIALMIMGGVVHVTLPGTEQFVRNFGPVLLYLLGSSLLIVAAGGICVGWGLMQHRPWARVTALILGVLALFHPPLGTALGIYTLWVLVGDDGGVQYRSMARAA